MIPKLLQYKAINGCQTLTPSSQSVAVVNPVVHFACVFDGETRQLGGGWHARGVDRIYIVAVCVVVADEVENNDRLECRSYTDRRGVIIQFIFHQILQNWSEYYFWYAIHTTA